MRIGILTFHFAHNYGAMLQSYALTKFLNKNSSLNAELIDYRLPFIYDAYERKSLYKTYLWYRSNGESLIKSLIKTPYKYHNERNKSVSWGRFESFLEKDLTKSPRIFKKEQINNKYDIIICGSDQIWNTELTGGFIDLYFGEKINASKKIAYAASNGKSFVEDKYLNKFLGLIDNFTDISVREEGLYQFLRKKDIECEFVLDPVFLLDKNDWGSISSLPSSKDYVLTYSFWEKPEFFCFAKKIADKLGKKLICFRFSHINLYYEDVEIYYQGGPKELLGYIQNADYVITNSFHGTALSIIYEKQFYSFKPIKVSERIISLLSNLGLNDRMIYDFPCSINLEKPIKYELVKPKLEKLKKQSQDFLLNAINKNE